MIENTVDVVSFLSKASADDIASIETAIKVRKDLLTAQRVDSLTPGMTVRLQGLRPKYLNGLSGEDLALGTRTREPSSGCSAN